MIFPAPAALAVQLAGSLIQKPAEISLIPGKLIQCTLGSWSLPMSGVKTIWSALSGEKGAVASTAMLGLSELARRSQFQPLPVSRSHGWSLNTRKPAG